MPKKTEKLRSGISRGVRENGVDREKNTIKGFSVISIGEALGHDLEIDKTTLEQVVEHGNKAKFGIKSRFGHPNMSNTAFGTFLGRVKNFELEDDKLVRADLYIDQTAMKPPPNGGGTPLGEYTMSLAESDPAAFGSSIVFELERAVRLNEDGTRKKDKAGNELLPLARVKTLYGADIVDEPATGDELFEFFSDSVKPSAEVTAFLDDFLKQPDAMDRVCSFMNKYNVNEEYKQKIINSLGKVDNMPEENKDTKKPIFQFSKGDDTMTEEEKKLAALEVAHKKEVEDAVLSAVTKEKERIDTVQALGKKFGIPDDKTKELLNQTPKLSLEDISKKLVDIDMGTGSAGVDQTKEIPEIHINKEARDKKLEIMSNTFLVKGGVIDDPKIREEVASSEYRGMGMKSCVAHFLSEAGVKDVHMLSGNELYSEIIKQCQRTQFGGAMAQGTGDFTNLLSNTMNKSMAKGWNDAPVTYPLWCGTDSLSDFKTADIIKMSAYGDVELIPEGDAPKESKMADTKETAKLATYGSYYTLTRQAIVNDDLSWFTRIPQRMTSSFRRTINYRVYWYLFNANVAPLTTNPWVGPTMTEDAVRLFNLATHRNYLAIGTGAAVSEATLTYGYNQMITQAQPSPDNNRSNVVYSPTMPKFLIHGPHQTLAVHKLLNSVFYSTSAGDPNDDFQISNIYGPGKPRSIVPIEEVLLDYWVTSTATYPWYLAADPSIADTITVFGLNGETRPTTTSEPSSIGEAQGIKYQVIGDFGIAAIDWRGLFLNTGR